MTDDQFTQLNAALNKLTALMIQNQAENNRRFNDVTETMATKQQVNSIYALLDSNIREHEKQELA